MRRTTFLLASSVLVGPAGCGIDLLEVDDSAIVVPADLDAAGPAAIPTLVNGVVGAYHDAADGIVRYSAMLSDEMILAGTFPTRFEVDARRIQPSNIALTEAVYTTLHRARLQADTVAFLFNSRLEDPAFADFRQELLEGIAIARFYAGYTRLWMGELYCWSILTGMFPEDAPLLPDERVTEALNILADAEAQASATGLAPVQGASLVGQARAHLWLGNYAQAVDAAAGVPRGFIYRAEYSSNDPEQYNGMYTFTWGDTQAIRWTVGDGSAGASGGERWPHLEEFLELNLLRDRPSGFMALSPRVPVVLQTLYSERGSDVLMASWAEAALIEAEVALRSGETPRAKALINDLRSDYSIRASLDWGVETPVGRNPLPNVELAGDVASDLRLVVAERARELWLTGDRQVTGRRLRMDPSIDIDLFPNKAAVGGGDDIAFPIPQLELDNNPNLGPGDACPAGQGPGSWN